MIPIQKELSEIFQFKKLQQHRRNKVQNFVEYFLTIGPQTGDSFV
jgi:hypothetical protein